MLEEKITKKTKCRKEMMDSSDGPRGEEGE
jgi:hypothetical protein